MRRNIFKSSDSSVLLEKLSTQVIK